MTRKYRFIIGLSPDEMGYMVPGYDFLSPTLDTEHGGLKEAPDPCKAKGAPDHYHETNSASSQIARAWACIASGLLDGKMPDAPACKGNTSPPRKIQASPEALYARREAPSPHLGQV